MQIIPELTERFLPPCLQLPLILKIPLARTLVISSRWLSSRYPLPLFIPHNIISYDFYFRFSDPPNTCCLPFLFQGVILERPQQLTQTNFTLIALFPSVAFYTHLAFHQQSLAPKQTLLFLFIHRPFIFLTSPAPLCPSATRPSPRPPYLQSKRCRRRPASWHQSQEEQCCWRRRLGWRRRG